MAKVNKREYAQVEYNSRSNLNFKWLHTAAKVLSNEPKRENKASMSRLSMNDADEQAHL